MGATTIGLTCLSCSTNGSPYVSIATENHGAYTLESLCSNLNATSDVVCDTVKWGRALLATWCTLARMMNSMLTIMSAEACQILDLTRLLDSTHILPQLIRTDKCARLTMRRRCIKSCLLWIQVHTLCFWRMRSAHTLSWSLALTLDPSSPHIAFNRSSCRQRVYTRRCKWKLLSNLGHKCDVIYCNTDLQLPEVHR